MEPKRNRNGSVVGVFAGASRVASHTFSIPSQRDPTNSYEVYVETIKPEVARCPCKRYVMIGSCVHARKAARGERAFAEEHPADYKREKALQRTHLLEARAEERAVAKLEKKA